MLEGLMQHDHPLTLQHLLGRMRGLNARAQVVTLTGEGTERATHGDVAERVDRLASALASLGVGAGDRVATFAWNNQRHLEVYLAAPCMGAVLHTLNIRLFAEQLTYIVNHAQDKVILVDASLVPVLEKLAPSFETVEHFVVMGDGDHGSLPSAKATSSCWPPRGRATTTRRSTTTRPRACATRAAPPATRRASCTRTARA